MKINCLFSLICLAAFSVQSQTINIPDANFKSKLLTRDLNDQAARDLNDQATIIDTNDDGEIQVSEALNISFLNVENSGIASLEGIQFFNKLKMLVCSFNQLTLLNYSLPELKHLGCDNNQITQLDIHNFMSIEHLDCQNNLISTLDFRMIEAGALICRSNLLTEFYVGALKDGIGFVDVSDNRLTSLEVINPGKRLEMINISLNPITNFKLEAYSVDYMVCQNTALAELDLSKIERESAFGNELFIDINPFLKSVNFKNNRLDFCIPDPDYDCVNSKFSLFGNPVLEFVCADEGDELGFLQPYAIDLGFTLTSDCALSTNNATPVSGSTIYPNPANDMISIHSNDTLKQVRILNMLGQVVVILKTAQANDAKVDVSNLKTGTYFLEMVSDKGRSIQKFLKQ